MKKMKIHVLYVHRQVKMIMISKILYALSLLYLAIIIIYEKKLTFESQLFLFIEFLDFSLRHLENYTGTTHM